ncbi:epoxyqueuosine reductase QueH [Candidatus Nomurabacteria bacterium]|nr:epoxyqueuosine reductase QueH [Candidatus Nomurabacteria bacterium]
MKKRLLLHSCCAPCSIYILQQLMSSWDLTVYFYDPNIHPRAEYNQRRDEMKNYTAKLGLDFIEGPYDSLAWLEKTKGLEDEPERGKRCDQCFDLRLGETARFAKLEKYDAFATVLTISPHKDAQKISLIGQKLAQSFGLEFLDRDWKKKDGFKISCALSKEQGFYRQDYCGCLYSKRDSLLRKVKREKNEN